MILLCEYIFFLFKNILENLVKNYLTNANSKNLKPWETKGRSNFVEKNLLTFLIEQSKIKKQSYFEKGIIFINKKLKSIQDLIPIEEILENGIIKLKKNNYIKIIKIIPINFNLKSNLEKEAILNSYKMFLKTCDFDIQILIQSKKEDLSRHFSIIKNNLKNKENNLLNNYLNNYIDFIKKINNEKKSSSKNYFLIIKENKNLETEASEEIIIQNLNDKYFKIKETLARCGNKVFENNKEEIINILFSFLNLKNN